VNSETQQEVNELSEKLSEGGKKERCGWLKDKHGVSWKVIPSVLGELMQDEGCRESSKSHKSNASNE
jgi:predicted 3-demethylubiquinone-9 3-methyltransferase (glyoxalase superfamily)